MATAVEFQPRPLSEEEKTKLDKAEQKLEKLEVKLEQWSDRVEQAPAGSEEERKALDREAFFRAERDKAQEQLDKLKIEFGQIPGQLGG